MKKGSSTVFLKAVLVFIAIAVLFAMIRLPQTEGRAADMDLMSIYADPFIIYGYIASIPFFVGLYQAFKLLGLMERGKVFSKDAIGALQNIRTCALLMIAFIIGAGVFIKLNHAPEDDPAGFFALCILTSGVSALVAAASALFAKLLRKKSKK